MFCNTVCCAGDDANAVKAEEVTTQPALSAELPGPVEAKAKANNEAKAQEKKKEEPEPKPAEAQEKKKEEAPPPALVPETNANEAEAGPPEKAEAAQAADAAQPAAEKEKPKEGIAQLKILDANGLAIMCFGFGTWLFFAFLCNVDSIHATGKHNGIAYLPHMLQWGVSMGLMSAGLVQGLNGDHLGFTSYLFHAAILGTIGYNFEVAITVKGAGPFHLIGFFCYAAAWFNIIFTVMAFRVAKMFGVLYASVALMFLLVGMNFQVLMSDRNDPTDMTGNTIAGLSCLGVSLQCFYLLVPMMTGKGLLM